MGQGEVLAMTRSPPSVWSVRLQEREVDAGCGGRDVQQVRSCIQDKPPAGPRRCSLKVAEGSLASLFLEKSGDGKAFRNHVPPWVLAHFPGESLGDFPGEWWDPERAAKT